MPTGGKTTLFRLSPGGLHASVLIDRVGRTCGYDAVSNPISLYFWLHGLPLAPPRPGVCLYSSIGSSEKSARLSAPQTDHRFLSFLVPNPPEDLLLLSISSSPAAE